MHLYHLLLLTWQSHTREEVICGRALPQPPWHASSACQQRLACSSKAASAVMYADMGNPAVCVAAA